MSHDTLSREMIIGTLVNALQTLEHVHALWEGGAASFDRVDEWSDIDLYIVVEDERVEDAFESLEQALLSLSEFDLRFRLPEPTWHGHFQTFYRLKKASPFLFLDVVVMKESSRDKFLQFRIHGEPVVHFDRTGVVKDDSPDQASFLRRVEERLDTLKKTFELFQVLTLKELNRGNDIQALTYYLGYTYKPLVEVLRIKHSPHHYNFYTTYVQHDLPPEVVKRLHKLAFVANCDDIRRCQAEAERWFWEVVGSIDRRELRERVGTDSSSGS